MKLSLFPPIRLPLSLVAVFALLSSALAESSSWWNKEWTGRKEFVIDTAVEGAAIPGEVGSSVVLVRLHPGNFSFELAREDGSDLRFVAEDDKTVLPHQIEKWDSLMTEAFVWVKVPEVKADGQTKFRLYFGNAGEMEAEKPKSPYETNTVLVYHFAERGGPAADSSEHGNNAENAGAVSEGAIIAGGLRFLGNNPVTVPATETLKWLPGGLMTWSAWVRPSTLQPNATVFSRKEGSNAFRIGLDQGAPFVEVNNGSGVKRTAATTPLAVNTWKHLAVVADGAKMTIYVDGEAVGSVDGPLPGINGPSIIGGDGTEALGFTGELDELEIAQVARPVGALKLAAVTQGGTDAATKLLTAGENEGGEGGHSSNHALEHVMLFGDIAKNMMFDGWVVIFCCVIMALVGWTVALKKFLYLNKIQKGSDAFLKQWRQVASDLTALDHGDADNVKSLGGKASAKEQKLIHMSPLYHIYHIGSEEIRRRLLSKNGFQGLSSRSIQAIRASLDSGLVHESHRLNGGLVFLTISIAGGPYVGLLGTVMGVMITFAVIAKTGEVEVNSIAPGIASALLATVAGLIVAIPALFIYSYLNSRIKTAVSAMQIFIDEFVTKMAEFYPTPGDMPGGIPAVTVPIRNENAEVKIKE